jgi:hypothetical protein
MSKLATRPTATESARRVYGPARASLGARSGNGTLSNPCELRGAFEAFLSRDVMAQDVMVQVSRASEIVFSITGTHMTVRRWAKPKVEASAAAAACGCRSESARRGGARFDIEQSHLHPTARAPASQPTESSDWVRSAARGNAQSVAPLPRRRWGISGRSPSQQRRRGDRCRDHGDPSQNSRSLWRLIKTDAAPSRSRRFLPPPCHSEATRYFSALSSKDGQST